MYNPAALATIVHTRTQLPLDGDIAFETCSSFGYLRMSQFRLFKWATV